MVVEFVQISTATDRREDAEKISRALVKRQLAACVQILGPITSIYSWKGKIETTEEWLLLIKTRRELFKKVEQSIKGLHSYETPEIIALPVLEGSRDYLGWLAVELAKKDVK